MVAPLRSLNKTPRIAPHVEYVAERIDSYLSSIGIELTRMPV